MAYVCMKVDEIPKLDCETHDESRSKYVAYEAKKGWHDAQATCEADGMSLATVHSKRENDAIRAVARNDVYWIGLNELDTEGSWEWIDSSTVDYINWRSGEPNNWNGKDEDCAAIGYSNGDQWVDAPCDWAIKFVCMNPDVDVAEEKAKSRTKFFVYDYKRETWNDAKDICENWDSTLATILNEEENALVVSLLKDDVYWIGLNDPEENDNFVWLDGSTSTYRKWNTDHGEPDNGRQRCVRISKEFEEW